MTQEGNMSAFVYLLRKEWIQYRSWLFVTVVAGLFILIGIPYLFTEVMGSIVDKSIIALVLMIFVLVTGGWITLMQFISSLRADVRRKEMWLHSTNSIYILVGAKILFTLLTFFVFTMIIVIVGLYLSQEIIVGSLLQYAVSIVLLIMATLLFQSSFIVSFNLSFVFYLQLKRFVGKFSIIITAVVFIGSFILLMKIVQNPLYDLLLRNGEVSLDFLSPYLLTFTMSVAKTPLGSMYIVEEIFSWGFLIFLFIISNKWLEKVVTR